MTSKRSQQSNNPFITLYMELRPTLSVSITTQQIQQMMEYSACAHHLLARISMDICTLLAIKSGSYYDKKVHTYQDRKRQNTQKDKYHTIINTHPTKQSQFNHSNSNQCSQQIKDICYNLPTHNYFPQTNMDPNANYNKVESLSQNQIKDHHIVSYISSGNDKRPLKTSKIPYYQKVLAPKQKSNVLGQKSLQNVYDDQEFDISPNRDAFVEKSLDNNPEMINSPNSNISYPRQTEINLFIRPDYRNQALQNSRQFPITSNSNFQIKSQQSSDNNQIKGKRKPSKKSSQSRQSKSSRSKSNNIKNTKPHNISQSSYISRVQSPEMIQTKLSKKTNHCTDCNRFMGFLQVGTDERIVSHTCFECNLKRKKRNVSIGKSPFNDQCPIGQDYQMFKERQRRKAQAQ